MRDKDSTLMTLNSEQTYYPEDDRGGTKQPEQKDSEYTDCSNPMTWRQFMPCAAKISHISTSLSHISSDQSNSKWITYYWLFIIYAAPVDYRYVIFLSMSYVILSVFCVQMKIMIIHSFTAVIFFATLTNLCKWNIQNSTRCYFL